MTTRALRTVCAALAGAGVVIALAGCGPIPDPDAAGHSAHTQNTENTAQQADSSDMDGMDAMHMGNGDGVTLWSVQKAGGTVLVTDGDGRAVYRSNADGNAPPRSSCAGACATEFEPVTIRPGQMPELLGVSSSAVGTVQRVDGATQVTLGGWPIYRHEGAAVAQPDPREFVARGWFVMKPNGDRVN